MRNLKKRFLPLLLSAVMILSTLSVPAHAESGNSAENNTIVSEQQTETIQSEAAADAPAEEPETPAAETPEEVPAAEVPAVEAPSEEPETPAAETPAEVPAAEEPAEEPEASAEEVPAAEALAEELGAPAAEVPAAEEPAEEPEAPAAEISVAEVPAAEAPAEEPKAPTVEVPAAEIPAEEPEAPAAEAPTVEVPAAEIPAEEPEAPATEVPAAEPEVPAAEVRETETRLITVTISWAGDIPSDFTYPEAVYVTMERSLDGENWEPFTEGGPFEITPDESGQWTAAFAVPASTEPAEPEEPQPYYYRVTEDPTGLGRFLRSDPVTVAPEDPGAVSFTNTYNDVWDYTVDLYWDRSGSERTHVNSITTDIAGDALVYKLDIRTQKTYEGIPTTVSDEELMNPTSGLVIRIPLHLLQDRDGNWVDPNKFSIHDDTNPTNDREFTYRIIGDSVYFYNYRTLPSSYTGNYTVSYLVPPLLTLDGSTGSLHADAVGHYLGQPATDPGTQSTPEITYRMDTGTHLIQLVKDDGCSLHYVNGALTGMEFDTEHYNYVWYIVRVNAEGNQPATVTVTDSPKVFDPATGQVVPGGEVVKVVKWNYTQQMPTVPVGKYPTSGTNVPFTTNADGSASWSFTYNAVRAHARDSHGRHIYTDSVERDFFVVVRYDKSLAHHGDDGAPLYHNNVTSDLEVNDPQNPGDVRPDPEQGIEGNDFNDTDSKFTTASCDYIPSPPPGPWPGGTSSIAKTCIGSGTYQNTGFLWVNGGSFPMSYRVTMTVNGYNLTDDGIGYSFTFWDDDVYARPVYKNPNTRYGDWTRLQAGADYDIVYDSAIDGNGSRVIVHMWQAVRGMWDHHETDPSLLPTEPFKVYGEKADGSWELIMSFTMANATISNVGEASLTVPFTPAMLNGKGYRGIKVETPEGLIDHCDVTLQDLCYRFRADSPTMAAWKAQYGDSLSSAQVLNFSTHRFYQEDETGNYVWSNPQTGPTGTWIDGVVYSSSDSTGLAENEKTNGDYELYEVHKADLGAGDWRTQTYKHVLNDSENDTTERIWRHHWRICSAQYINSYVNAATWAPIMAMTGVFYDLLPPNYSIDLTRPIAVSEYTYGINTGTSPAQNPDAALDGPPL